VDSGFGIQESGKNHKGASLNPVLPESWLLNPALRPLTRAWKYDSLLKLTYEERRDEPREGSPKSALRRRETGGKCKKDVI
jgi:hypothetical protein